jgi:hypothetical protein
MLSNTTYILQTVFYQHSLKKYIKFVTKVYNIFTANLDSVVGNPLTGL